MNADLPQRSAACSLLYAFLATLAVAEGSPEWQVAALAATGAFLALHGIAWLLIDDRSEVER